MNQKKYINRKMVIVCLYVVTSVFNVTAQTATNLQTKVDSILSAKQLTAGVVMADKDGNVVLSVHGDQHFPLQSVYKFHIAIAVLQLADAHKLSLSEKIRITGNR